MPIKSGFLVLFLLLCGSSTAYASAWSDAAKAKIDEAIAKNFKNKTQVGIVVGVIHGDEKQVWSYGERILGTAESPSADTFFEMGSITKTFTNTLLALEVNRGRVRLTDPIQLYWPELQGTDAGAITFEQLATHTSGLPRMPDNFSPSDPLNPYKDYDEILLLDFLKKFKQGPPAPHASVYSNLGMGLLGYVLATKLNGTDFASYVSQNLTQPLGLNDTKITLDPNDSSRTAQGYDNFFDRMPLWDFGTMAPAGALKTTLGNLMKYLEFNMRPDESPIGKAALLAQTPRAQSDSAGFRVGLAWYSGQLGTHDVVTHSGATGGYRADLIFDRENQLGFVMLANTDMMPACVDAAVFDFKCNIPEFKQPSPEKQNQLLGSYFSKDLGMTLTVFSGNGILGLQQDSYRMRLWEKSADEFYIPDANATIRFGIGPDGSATQFTLLQNGAEFLFLKQNRYRPAI